MSVPENNPPFQVTQTVTRGETTFELLEYNPLTGSETLAIADQLYALNRSGVRLRQLRIRLVNDGVRTEPEVLQFLKGHVEMESSTGTGEGVGGFMKGVITVLHVRVKPFLSRFIEARARSI
jgi:uncharacterized protein (AIM24 family)